MTAFDYVAAATDARELLAEFGAIGTIQRATRTGGGATDPNPSAATGAPIDALMCVLPIDQRDVDGTIIQTGDWRVLIEATADEITTGDRVTPAGYGALVVYDPGKLAPIGNVVFYDAKARG